MSVLVPPSVAELVASDPDTADEMATALAGDETLAVPTIRLDPSTAVRSGLSDQFTATLRDGEDVLDDVLPSSPGDRSVWIATEPVRLIT